MHINYRHSTILVALLTALTLGLSVTSAEAQPLRRSSSRLRLGAEVGGGGDWGTPRGPSLGVVGQLGLQFNDTFALFYQPSLYIHALGTSDNADTFAAMGNLAMADATVGPLQMGLGGGFDLGRFADCASNTCARGDLAVHPALGGRLALVLGLRAARGRLGIPFAFHVHTAFLDRDHRLTTMILTVGIQRF